MKYILKQTISLAFVLVAVDSVAAQFGAGSGRPLTLPALLTMVRYQNTACQGEQQDYGTCLADQECSRRGGQSVGPCASGYATCCSFKVGTRANGCEAISPRETTRSSNTLKYVSQPPSTPITRNNNNRTTSSHAAARPTRTRPPS
jgi:hypothetical protein